MKDDPFGRILYGSPDVLREAWTRFAGIPVDWDIPGEAEILPVRRQRTIAEPVELAGKGTFARKKTSHMRFEPYDREGWWLDRTDQELELPIRVSVRNVWTTGQVVSNIVLRSGGPHNYVRMVEHIVALRMGLGLDNLLIRMDSGDPPLFNRGSMDIVEALDHAGRREAPAPVNYVTVKEPVTIGGPGGQFLTLAPCEPGRPELTVDCAVDFPTAIGQQRIRFPVTEKWLRYAACARTNTTHTKAIYCWTIGKVFADVRNLGYTRENVSIASRRKYINEPRLLHNGKSLEAAWHRAVLDLLAALALIDEGHFVGRVTSYKSGHRMDVGMVTLLYLHDLLTPVTAS